MANHEAVWMVVFLAGYATGATMMAGAVVAWCWRHVEVTR